MDLLWQIISILCVSLTMLFCWDQLCTMQYSYYRIIVRLFFYRDFKPIDWLVRNLEYIGFAMLLIGHFFSLLGLLEQLKLGQIHNKSVYFYASSPMNNIGLVLAFGFILRKQMKRIFL